MERKRLKLLSIMVVLIMVSATIMPGTAFAEGEPGPADPDTPAGIEAGTGEGESTGTDSDEGEGTGTDSDEGEGTGTDSDEGEGTDPDADEGEGTDPGAGEGSEDDSDSEEGDGIVPGPAMMMMLPRATPGNDLYVDPDLTTDDTHFNTIKDAIIAATPGAVIHVAVGDYSEGKIEIDKDLTITGADKDRTIIKPTEDITGTPHTDAAGWFVVKAGNEFNLNNVTLDGYGKNISTAIISKGSGVIDSNIVKNINGGHKYYGVGIELHASDMTVSNNSFRDIQRVGVYVGYNTAETKATIEDNEYLGKGEGDHLDYAFEVGRGGHADITGNTISGNRGIADSDSSRSAGIQVTSYFVPETPAHANIEDNTISDCIIGVLVGYSDGDGSVVTVNSNNLAGNDIGINSTALTVNAKRNWWGTSTAADILANTTGNVDYEPFYTSDSMDETAYAFNVVNETKEISSETIQGAIDAADDGDRIKVPPGLYEENISITKPLTLRGATHGIDKTSADYDNVTSDGSWDTTRESVIQSPDPSQDMSCVVDINSTSDVTFDGFVVQELHADGAQYDSLVRVTSKDSTTGPIENIQVINNVIGPFTNIDNQDGSQGRMGLYIVNDPYDSTLGVTNSTFAKNRIFGAEGNGNNVFIWSAYHAYGATGSCSMTGTAIEYNDIYGANRSGIETAGGFSDLTIRNNKIHDNGVSDETGDLKYGNGILLIRGAGDKADSSGFGPENLTIRDNEIYNNGKNGIYSGPMIQDTLIKGNDIRDNGGHGVLVDLEEQYYGGANPEYDEASGVTLTGNAIIDNVTGAAVQGTPTNDFIIKAVKNWWGASTSAEIRSMISDNVSFDPWYSSSDMDLLDSDKPVINETKGVSYDTIQEAINDADEEDTISVAAGEYIEDVVINKDKLRLKGTGAANTKIVATDADKYPLQFSANDAIVEGFTLTHAYTEAELDAWTFNNNGVTFGSGKSGNTLRSCIITLNRNGIYLNNTQNNKIINNIITNNRTGINMTSNCNGTEIKDNTISDNWTLGLVTYTGTVATNLTTVEVTRNTFDGNWYSEILVKDAAAHTGTLDVSDNTFSDSPVTYSTSADPILHEPGWADQKPAVSGITGGTAVKPTEELPTLRIYNSGSVVLKYDGPKTLNVGSGGYSTIQAAVDAASAGDTIQVAEGTYNEKLNITKGVSIIGAGRDKVTVDATTASAYGITIASSDVTLKDFTLLGSTSNNNSRYGIHVGSGGHQNITISDLKVQNFYRTGIDINGADGVTVSNVTAVDNGGNGLQTCDARNVTFSGITTSGNAWGGIGIFTYGRYSPIGTDGIVIAGVNSFGESTTSNGAIYLEEGNYATPTNPRSISFSTDPADNANVTFLSDDFQYMLSGNSDVNEKYKRFYPTLEQVISAANGNPSHITTERYIRRLSDGSFYVPVGLGIQTAINAASAGDIIQVEAGTYNEALRINKSVELRGAQYGVDARNREASESTITGGIVSITSAGAIIDGFAFAPPVWEGRISPNADNITIKNSIIERAIYHTRNPIKAIEGFTLDRNWFKNISGRNSAIVMEGATEDLTINNNLFTDISYSAIILGATAYEDTVISGNAIYRTESQAINLGGDHNNTIVSNNYIERANMSREIDKGGIRVYGTDFTGPVKITGNTVVNSFNGFCVRDGGNITGKAITVEKNIFTGNSNAGVYNGASLGAVNAEKNYWGGVKPSVEGNVSYFPWFVDEGKTRLSNQGFNLTASNKTKTNVTLSWSAVPDADGYNLYNGDTKVNSAVIDGKSYTVTGLNSATTYVFSLKIVDGDKEYSITDPALSVTTSASSGTGTTKPPEQPQQPPAPAALTDPQTKDDQKLADTLKSTGQASLDLADTGNATAGLSTNIIIQLAQEKAPLVVKNAGVQVDFSPNSLITPELTNALNQSDAVVELGARQVSEEEKQEILESTPLGESTGIFEVGGIIVDLSANISSGGDTSTKIQNFAEPVAVTIDLSDLNLTAEQISELSGVRFEKDDTGAIVPIPLGGSYDPETKMFTFYTTRFSLYSVVQVPDLVKVELIIGNAVASINGADSSMDVPPDIINSRTMVPLRFIGEALGAEFEWDAKTRTVTFNLDGKELQVVIDQNLPGMDAPATIMNNRTIVPIRYIAEAFGAEVTWFPSERKVMIVN